MGVRLQNKKPVKAKVSAKGLEFLSPEEGTLTNMGVRLQNKKLVKVKVSAKGLEPLTNGLKGHCSTIELRAHFLDGLYSNTHIIRRQ